MRSRFHHHTPEKVPALEEHDVSEDSLGGSSEEHPPLPKRQQLSLQNQRDMLLAVTAIFAVAVIWTFNSGSNSVRGANECKISFGDYKGPQYFSPSSGSVGKPKCLVESKWLKLSQHSVKIPGGEETYADWLWVDYHDRVNILVEAEAKEGEEQQFLVFEQSKYALEGLKKKAIVGGIIEQGEHPEVAARREVFEEMGGLQCDTFHPLGRFRTDVNRGMGWVNSFLATDCSHDKKVDLRGDILDEVGAPDSEVQDMHSITLPELKKAVLNNEFLEVQWTATVTMALLYLDTMDS